MFPLRSAPLFGKHVQISFLLKIIWKIIVYSRNTINACDFLCQQPENVGHMLWECPMYGLDVGGKIQKMFHWCPRLLYVVLGFWLMVDKLSQPEMEQWAVTSWAIWNARNKFYFERIQTHPKSILDGALGFLDEYQRLVAAQRTSW